MQTALILAFLVALGSFLSLFKLKGWAQTLGAVDIPGERSFHSQPIPRAGGIAIVFFTILGLVICQLAFDSQSRIRTMGFLIGAGLIAAVSLADDIRKVSSLARLLTHSTAAIVLILSCGYWELYWLPGPGVVNLGFLGAIITFLWLVGLTNAYNFMDGIDGIAATQAVVAGIGWFLALEGFPLQTPALLAILLAGSSLGFLVHNWPKASIFMGDLGSAFLGFSFASIGLMMSESRAQIPILAGFMVLPFVLDSSLTFLRRAFKGEDLLAPHQSHLYQRLVILGFSQARVTVLYGALAVLSVAVALLWRRQILENGELILGCVVAFTLAFWRLVVSMEKSRQ